MNSMREIRHSIKYNAVMNMILTSSSVIFPLITVPYVSRVLNPAGIGAVSFAQSIVSYFSLVALLGIQTYGVRACSQVRDDEKELSKVVEELIVILGMSTTIVFICYIVAILFVPRFSDDKPIFYIFGIALWLASFGVEWFYQAIEQYGYITIRNIVIKIIGLVLMLIFVRDVHDYTLYGGIVVFTGYGANILNILRLWKLIKFCPLNELNIKRHLRPMRYFFISSISSGMYVQSDIVILGFIASNSVVGIYQLVSKIKSMLMMAINSVVNVMLPRLSYYAVNDKRQYKNLLTKNIAFVLLFASAGIAVASLNGAAIIDILGGVQYRGAITPLLLILPALLFASINTVLSQYLISSGREKQYAIVNFVGLLTSIIYCLTFIPLFGASGAALSSSLCEFTALIVRCVLSKEFISRIISRIQIWQAPLSAVISGMITYYSTVTWIPNNSFMHILVTCIIFSLLYTIALLLMRENITMAVLKRIVRK